MSSAYEQMCVRAASDGALRAKDAARRGLMPQLALYYKRRTEREHGELLLFDSDTPAPSGFVRADAPLLSSSVPYTHYYGWIRRYSGSLPILCPNLPLTAPIRRVTSRTNGQSARKAPTYRH